MERKATQEERKEIEDSLMKGQVFYESGLWAELTDRYGVSNQRDIWELLSAVFDGQRSKAEGLMDKLEASRPKQ